MCQQSHEYTMKSNKKVDFHFWPQIRVNNKEQQQQQQIIRTDNKQQNFAMPH